MDEQRIFELEQRERENRDKQRKLRRKLRQKNRIILLETVLIFVLVIVLIVVSVGSVNSNNDTATSTDSSLNVGGTSSDNLTTSTESTVSGDVGSLNSVTSANSSVSNVNSSNTQSTQTTQPLTPQQELAQWYMKLVNPDNSVSSSYIDSIKRSKIADKYLVSTTKDTCKYLDSRIVSYFESMCKAAKNDGITLVSVSAYRSISYQSGLYDRRVERCRNEDGLSLEEAKKKAATIVAVPGTSEHHLGLAIDINSVETSFENTKAFRWLQQHAEEYGFVLRYPKDKQAITKIIYEPWHYRYVGVEHAKAMNDLGMCLEEYVQYLSTK